MISIIIYFSGCIGNNSNNDTREMCNYDYNIFIESNSSYNVLVPIPVYSDVNREIIISNLNENLRIIDGNATFNIQNTSFGPALMINGNGSNTIGFSGSDLNEFLIDGEYTQLFLSLAQDKDNDGYYDDEYGKVDYHLKLEDNSLLRVNMEFIYSHENGPGTYIRSAIKIEGHLVEGWNNVEGTFITEIE